MYIAIFNENQTHIANITNITYSLVERVYDSSTFTAEGLCVNSIDGGKIAVLSDDDGIPVFSCFVDTISYNNGKTGIKGRDFISLWDTDVLLDYTAAKSFDGKLGAIFDKVKKILFEENTDSSVQTVPVDVSMSISKEENVDTSGLFGTFQDQYKIVNAYAFLKAYLKYYGYYISRSYDIAGRKINFFFEKSQHSLEIDLNDFISELTTSDSAINKAVATIAYKTTYDDDGKPQARPETIATRYYYRTNENKIVQSDKVGAIPGRIYPVKQKVFESEYLSDAQFNAVYELANAVNVDNIVIKNSQIVGPVNLADYPVFTTVSVYYNGQLYKTLPISEKTTECGANGTDTKIKLGFKKVLLTEIIKGESSELFKQTPTGGKGEKGDKGDPGPAGPAGEQGATGGRLITLYLQLDSDNYVGGLAEAGTERRFDPPAMTASGARKSPTYKRYNSFNGNLVGSGTVTKYNWSYSVTPASSDLKYTLMSMGYCYQNKYDEINFTEPILYEQYRGSKYYEYVYLVKGTDEKPVTPSTNALLPNNPDVLPINVNNQKANKWYRGIPAMNDDDKRYMFASMRERDAVEAASYYEAPFLYATYSKDGEQGPQGDYLEWAFLVNTDGSVPSAPTGKITATPPATPVANTWYATTPNLTPTLRYMFCSSRKFTGETKTYSDWMTPTLYGRFGTDADVTPVNVFNALTDNGKHMGAFDVKDHGGNVLEYYINANYIKSGQVDADLVFAGNIVSTKGNIGGLAISESGLNYVNATDGKTYLKFVTSSTAKYNLIADKANFDMIELNRGLNGASDDSRLYLAGKFDREGLTVLGYNGALSDTYGTYGKVAWEDMIYRVKCITRTGELVSGAEEQILSSEHGFTVVRGAIAIPRRAANNQDYYNYTAALNVKISGTTVYVGNDDGNCKEGFYCFIFGKRSS